MLKILGIRQALPSALSIEDFEKIIMITSGNVQPIPPIQRYAEYINSDVTTFKLAAVAAPDVTSAIFAVIAAKYTGFVTGCNTQLEIPTEYRKQKMNIRATKPNGV